MDPLSCRDEGRRDNHRQHLHARQIQEGECQTMQRFHEHHCREPSGDSGDAPTDDRGLACVFQLEISGG
jgi:hypothetical protein